MQNKYLYAFLKDPVFRSVCILSCIGVFFCLVLMRLCLWQSLILKDIQDKQAMISRIPEFQAKMARMKTLPVPIVNLTLNGVIFDKARPIAVINNTFVKIGSEIEGRKVVNIQRYSATVCDVKAPDKCLELYLEQ